MIMDNDKNYLDEIGKIKTLGEGPASIIKKYKDDYSKALKDTQKELQKTLNQNQTSLKNAYEIEVSQLKHSLNTNIINKQEYNRKYKEEQEKLNKELEKIQEDYDKGIADFELQQLEKLNKQKLAIEKANLNSYKKMTFSEQKQLREQELKDIETHLDELQSIREAMWEDLSESEQSQLLLNIASEEAKAQKLHDLKLGYLAAERRAEEDSVGFLHKAQIKNENYLKRLEEHEKNTHQRDIALAQLAEEEDEGSEEYLAKKFAIDNEFSGAEEEADKRYGEYSEGKAKRVASLTKASDELGAASDLAGAAGLGGLASGFTSILDMVDVVKAALSGNPLGLILKAVELISKLVSKIGEGVDEYATIQEEYIAKINTRLDKGTSSSSKMFSKLTSSFSRAFGGSKYMSQKSLIQAMGELVDAGIAYNLEQRTILSELSDRMVSTFDMLDEHLTRLTKLQQADMSVAQLGSESYLTEFLNRTFSDNSYMSDMYDTVASSIIDASSQLNAKDAVSFTYNVQKWLGSLYSLGMSSGGISTIAEGINAIATGDWEYFNGNDSARTLFAMASGGSFSDLLVNGLNASNVNDLMHNIIDYLAQISTDTNKVTKQVKAGLFGNMSLSDIRSVANLTSAQVSSIYSETTDWDDSIAQVSNYLLGFAEANTTLEAQANNIIDNILFSMGQTLVEDQTAYTKIVIANKLGSTLGGIVTFVESLGHITDIFDNIGNAISGMTLSLSDSLQKAGTTLGYFSESKSLLSFTDRNLIKSREELYSLSSGVSYGISSSAALGYNNSNDAALVQSLAQNATTVKAGMQNYSEGATSLQDINTLYAALFEEQLPIRVILSKVEENAQNDLTQKIYRVNENELANIIDNIQDTKTYLGYKLSGWFGRDSVQM